MPEIKKAVLEFDLKEKLSLNYGHKLRGFFANKFENVLFHHHKENGDLKYSYPLIQYKIINGKPTVIGLDKGAKLVGDKFLDVENLTLAGKKYTQIEKRLNVIDEEMKVVTNLEMPKFKYKFYSPWMGLNQTNYKKYLNEIKNGDCNRQREFFKKIIIGNILTFAKGVNWWIENTIKVVPNLDPIDVKFKNKDMTGFTGEFCSNVSLPQYIGLGKSTARGFGTIIKEEII
ncbi:CRISPR-associated endonuclease Cas6 [Sporohalobacter salinus]|uniref:CRISPR-associated endonuclease Cas6 n=1 Tax=Sporohalobacter salinus TaxID=1494606 RepID=UPI0019614D9A|nr:CRISPR-associated endonuclease Cas6 [Sporohalobacter salinus]MBM7624060.1 hypothetical protein [Sporohalobacter salinus]